MFVVSAKSGKPLKRDTKQSIFGFSVDKGVRNKWEAVLDSKGKIVKTNGLPTYKEMPAKGAEFTQDIGKIFEISF